MFPCEQHGYSSFLSSLAQDFIEDPRCKLFVWSNEGFLSSLAQDFLEERC